MQEPYKEIPELAAARVVAALMESRPASERPEIVEALLSWVLMLVRDCDAKTRAAVARGFFVRAVWLAGPHEVFDQEAVRIVRKGPDEWPFGARPANGLDNSAERESGDCTGKDFKISGAKNEPRFGYAGNPGFRS